MHHILVGCVFSRITWDEALSWCRLPIAPPDGQTELFEWWSTCTLAAPSCFRKGFASLVIITAWAIWKHRNNIIFDGLQPSNGDLLATIKDEARRWARSGTQGLDRILPVT